VRVNAVPSAVTAHHQPTATLASRVPIHGESRRRSSGVTEGRHPPGRERPLHSPPALRGPHRPLNLSARPGVPKGDGTIDRLAAAGSAVPVPRRIRRRAPGYSGDAAPRRSAASESGEVTGDGPRRSLSEGPADGAAGGTEGHGEDVPLSSGAPAGAPPGSVGPGDPATRSPPLADGAAGGVRQRRDGAVPGQPPPPRDIRRADGGARRSEHLLGAAAGGVR